MNFQQKLTEAEVKAQAKPLVKERIAFLVENHNGVKHPLLMVTLGSEFSSLKVNDIEQFVSEAVMENLVKRVEWKIGNSPAVYSLYLPYNARLI